MEHIKNNFKNCDKIINNIRKSFDSLIIDNIDDGINAVEQYLDELRILQNDILSNNLVLLSNKPQDLITHLELVLQSYKRHKQAYKIKCENSYLIYCIIYNKYNKLDQVMLKSKSEFIERKLYNRNGIELRLYIKANKILKRYISMHNIDIPNCKILGKNYIYTLDK